MWKNLKAKLTFDRDTGLKWLFILGAGVLGLVADVFDRKKKDRLYEEKIDREVAERVGKLMEGKDDE